MKIFEFEDNQYPFQGFNHKRIIVRAFVYDEDGNYAIHRLFRDDDFCRQGYYETPGGGVDENESLEEALRREIEEELGYQISNIQEIAIVKDAYNKIGRQNENHYFLAKKEKYLGKHFESDGDSFIKESLWLPIEEIEKRYLAMADTLVSGLVKQRELPIIKMIKNRIFD